MNDQIKRRRWLPHSLQIPLGGRSFLAFFLSGNCWSLFKLPTKQVMGGNVTWYAWWRIMLSVQGKSKSK